MKFRKLDVIYDHGEVDLCIINEIEKVFSIHFPESYVELIRYHNGVKFKQDSFNYFNPYNNEEGTQDFGFDSIATTDYLEPPSNILHQYIYNDETYGYSHVYSFGSTAEGNWVCFDYRDNPQGNEPKICIVIHDEYDDETGKHLLFPVAENFEQFLDGLYEFDWSQFDGDGNM